ncbi:HdeD family acid-resistance protein [Streptomyces albidoflavus]|uniref:HdeD family acid-resistance protein n=1 Tax=Streptomyces albidoflavus TaxID=1886 RepID=UPI00341437D2
MTSASRATSHTPGYDTGAPPGADSAERLARAAWQSMLLAGVAALGLGVVVLVWPGVSLLVAGVVFGVYLLVSGITQLVSVFGTHRSVSLRVMGFVSGALTLLLGLFCLRGATQSILLLALWIGIGWLFRGVTHLAAAVSDPGMPARGWQILTGIISVLGGVVLIVSPFASLTLLTVVAGIWLLVLGATEIAAALAVRRERRSTAHPVS